jgi:hypothetical protein
MNRGAGVFWMIRRFGFRRWWLYRQARRAAVTIDYTKILSPDERAILGEHVTTPWERPEE